MEKKLNFKVCGLPAKYFIPFFIIVMATVYLGFMPVVLTPFARQMLVA